LYWSIAPGFCLTFEYNFSWAFAQSLLSRKLPVAATISHRLIKINKQISRLFLYLTKQSAAKLPEKRLSLGFLVQQFLHLLESNSPNVVQSPAARQQDRHQYY